MHGPRARVQAACYAPAVTRYVIERPLSNGRRWWLGRHPDLDRPVAIKRVPPEEAEDRVLLHRFEREPRLVGSIKHPNVVMLLDATLHDSEYMLVYEYVPGPNLREALHARKLSVALILAALLGTARGLAAAHNRGIMHRDLRPDHVLGVGEGGAKLGGFHVACPVGSKVRPQKGILLGHPAYTAPEIVRGEPTSPAADIYALGAMLFEALAGRPPFAYDDGNAVLKAHLSMPVPALTVVRPDLPHALQDLVVRAMAKDPADRLATASMFAEELQALLEESLL